MHASPNNLAPHRHMPSPSSMLVALTGDGTNRSMILDLKHFGRLLDVLQMRQLSQEPRTHAFRPHSVAATMVVQRIDRLWDGFCARESREIISSAEGLRSMAELSDRISWSRA